MQSEYALGKIARERNKEKYLLERKQSWWQSRMGLSGENGAI